MEATPNGAPHLDVRFHHEEFDTNGDFAMSGATRATPLLLSLIFLTSCQHVTTNEPEVQPASIEDIIKETKVGYVRKRASEIEINATSSDIVVVMMGGSSGPVGNNTLGGSDMTDQGFKLIDLAGTDDCRIEGWVKIWGEDDGNNVMIPLRSRDAG